MIRSQRPAAALGAYVEALWHYSGQHTARHKERVLPSGRFQIIVDLAAGRAAVSGMRSQYTEIEPAAITSVMGVLVRPGAARALLEGPASAFGNQLVPLQVAWGSRAMELLDRLQEAVSVDGKLRVLESALLLTTQHAGDKRLTLHPSVHHGLERFRCAPHIRSVAHVAREAGLSRRRFGQLFREQVGTTPKLYCRLRRFRRVVRQIATGGEVDWASVALDGGYCDQAHLSHEFRDFSGLSPGDYVAAERPFPNHVRVD